MREKHLLFARQEGVSMSDQDQVESKPVKQKNWFMRHKILTIIIIIIVIGAIKASGSSSIDENTSDSISSPAETEQVEEQMSYEEVDMVAFISEFDNNQLAAEDKYKDKNIKLTAKISNISEDIMGNPFLSLEPINGGDYYMGTHIQCIFEDKSSLMNVANGQVVTVQGVASEQTLGIIGIDNCQIVE